MRLLADAKKDRDRRPPRPAGRRERTPPSSGLKPKKNACRTTAGGPQLRAEKQLLPGIRAIADRQRNRRSGPACAPAKVYTPKDDATARMKYLRGSED